MTNVQVVTARELTGVGADTEKGVAFIKFTLDGPTYCALEFPTLDIERLNKALANLVIDLADKHGLSSAQEVTRLRALSDLAGSVLVLELSNLTTESVHLSLDQTKELHETLGRILSDQESVPIQ